MAGVTNAPFRVLCRRFGEALCTGEMIAVRAYLAGHPRTLRLASFLPDEEPRSLQLYAVEPAALEEAARRLAAEGVRHLDLNLGCPARKVTAAGGGAALPWKRRLLGALLRALRRGAGDDVAATVKMRLGIDAEHLTYLEAGRIAEDEGLDAVTLHARTAADLYGGTADWERIGELQAALSIPVLGNGDVRTAADALDLVRRTGCRGVAVGRAVLGRPWFLRELEAAFAGRQLPPPPTAGEIRAVVAEHARLLEQFFGPRLSVLHLRKHAAWYVRGFPGGARLRARLVRIESAAEALAILAELPPDLPYPQAAARARRAKSGRRQKVALPPGWLADRDGLPALVEECADGG